MDKLDETIIAELQKEGRQTNTKVARKLGVSESTVRRRVNRLLSDEIIKITAVPDLTKVGFNTVALIAIQANLQQLDNVTEALAQNTNVHYVAQTAGRFDIIIWVLFHSSQELADFIKRDLVSISGIRRTETLINTDIKKGSLGWISTRSSRSGRSWRQRRKGTGATPRSHLTHEG